LILSYYFTKNKFKVVSYNKKEDQGNINLNDSINFMVRPIVFFIATIFIWFRIDFFLLAIHFNILHSYAQIVLSVIFGIVFSLWPSSSLNGLAYSFILVHIRAAYLIIRIVALVVKILAFLLCLIVYILIITYPILIYFSIIYFLYPYFSGSIDLSNVTYVILIIGCITILIMTVRATWDILVDLSKDKLKMPSKIIVLISRNLKFFNKKVDINTIIFKKMCRRLYNNISTFTLHLGAFLGGNIL
jgi:hypothetical protein